MKRVLILAYSFPPGSEAGAQRPWGLYRRLAGLGWEPTVLTASSGSEAPNVVHVPDLPTSRRARELLGIPPNSRGALARGLRGMRRLLAELTPNPEEESGWRSRARSMGLKLLADGRFDLLFSTSPPTTTHLVARDLKNHSGLPWVADLRDLWAENYSYPWSPLRRRVDRARERRVLGSAEALVTVSEPLSQALGGRHGFKVSSVPNGFDDQDAAPANHPLSGRFTIAYTGSLYPGKQAPHVLLEAIAFLVKRKLLDAASLDLRFFGRNVDDPSLSCVVATLGLERHVRIGGLLPRPEALEQQRHAQILLLLDWMDPGHPGVSTGKLFEYLAARRPILSIGPPGSVVDGVLKETGAGRQCSTVAEVAGFLQEAHREFEDRGRVPYGGDLMAMQRYDHGAMARGMAAVFDRVTG